MGGLKDELGKISANVKKEKTLNERKESNSNSKYYYAACVVVLLLIACYYCGKGYLRYLIRGKFEILVPILYNKFKLADKTNLTLGKALKEIDIDKNDKLVVLSLMSQITYDGKWENINESTRKTMDLIWHAWRISCDSSEENCSLSKLFSYNGELHKMIKDLNLQ